MTIEQQAQSLKEYGVLVLENALSEDYVERCKNDIFDYFSNLDNISKGYRDSNQTIKSDGFNYVGLETCAEIVENSDVIDIMREVTNNSIRWVHHSDVHINFSGAKQFHTDEQARLWPSETLNNVSYKDKEYEVYRLATYLTEHTEEDGAPFFVKPKSHTSSYTGISYLHARLRHQGGNMKGDRAAMFWAFGDDNLHSKYHSMAAIKRQMNQNFQDEYVLSKTLSDMLDKHNIVYDIDKDDLKHFMEISPNLDSY